MSFNIRFDGKEWDDNNHFTKRLHRLSETIQNWKPYVIGLQEPSAGQVLHLQSVLPSYYQAIGFHRTIGNLDHPSRHNDFQVAILYDNRILKLMERDYIWLSKTPRLER
ncbi:unnamed protein product, partial [Didymodactylos carnosus]